MIAHCRRQVNLVLRRFRLCRGDVLHLGLYVTPTQTADRQGDDVGPSRLVGVTGVVAVSAGVAVAKAPGTGVIVTRRGVGEDYRQRVLTTI